MKKRSKKKDVRERLQGFDAMKSNTDDGRGGRGKKRILLRNDQGERGKGKKEGVRRRVLKRELGRGAPREGEVRILGGLMIFSCSPLGGWEKDSGKSSCSSGPASQRKSQSRCGQRMKRKRDGLA